MTKPDDINFNRIMAGLGEVLDMVEGRAAPARTCAPRDMDLRARWVSSTQSAGLSDKAAR